MIHGRTLNLSQLTLAISAAFISGTTAAQSPDANHETLVVTGNPLQMTEVVIDADQLDKRQANDLSDIFRADPEVSIGGGSSVSQKIYVRGLEDNMLNVTIDGATQSGNIYHHQGRLSIEPELLQQVEVAAGAGRATNGPGALGGTIRFKTKNPEDLLRNGERYGAW
ncbi:TonB-dependent receptor plug domain-containing protein [Photobacterium swingsii]|uniref:TonB-dependent receptor plug domain-containing protein n=1 Tax=Photobacterium swingsii TaxID=680026 RepID=UPI000AFF42A9|nr:TonB-dependent receptor plug domain-containing protein [Photobacterium swingsii]